MNGDDQLMAVNLRGVTAVLLPGTGSDDDYVYRAFSDALHGVGAVLVTPAPQPQRLIDGYRDALDDASRAAPIAVGGVSIGAAVAASWALAHPGLAQMRAGSPAWLADELTRSWVGQWPSLPDAMDEAARYVAPTCGQLEGLTVPMGVASATDDPVHPVEVGFEWVAAAPRAALRTVTLDEMGANPGVLGAACLAALLEI
jgi:pimeloyl-ACP methyl ester carboxylesterase